MQESTKVLIQQLNELGFDVNQSSKPVGNDAYLDQPEFLYLFWMYEVFKKVRTVPGHILEVGVARGRNAIVFGHLIKQFGEGLTRRYYGIDTFDGFTEEDLERSPFLDRERWKSTTKAFVENRLKQQGLHGVSKIYQGDVKEIAPDFVDQLTDRFAPKSLKLALLYIDCNAFLPSKFSMDFFKDYMSPGGIVCIDEKVQGGETEALAAFCKENKLPFLRDPGPFGVPAYTIIE